jgi:predicted nucleotidyltransferase/HEPN domain-containing protein
MWKSKLLHLLFPLNGNCNNKSNPKIPTGTRVFQKSIKFTFFHVFSPWFILSHHSTFTPVRQPRVIYHPKQPFHLKTLLDHLPVSKQEELISIKDMVIKLVNPEMIILFGSYSRGDWVEDRYRVNGTLYEYKSDFDILVVTEHHQDMPFGFAKQVRKKIRKAENFQTEPHIIFHDINFLNKELEEGHYFFKDILEEGTMLYTSGKHELATPKVLSPKERANKARLYFDNWNIEALDFYDMAISAKDKGKLKISIFILDQSAERFFMTILLVFTDYKPQTHDLNILYKQACLHDPRFKITFPQQTEEEKRLFIILVKSYIDSRYKMGYTIAAEDLQYLIDRVFLLKTLTETICQERIDKFIYK